MSKDLPLLKATRLALTAALQKGVKALFQFQLPETNIRAVKGLAEGGSLDAAALGGLLVKKGVITEEEWLTAVNATTRHRVDTIEGILSKAAGTSVKLFDPTPEKK